MLNAKKQSLSITKLDTPPDLLAKLTKLPSQGILKINSNNLTYLSIADDYIHQSFPFILDPHTSKPDYFTHNKNFIGAHISLIYPEEQKICAQQYLNLEYEFTIEGLFSAVLNGKKYYALKVVAPSLVAIRQALGLTDQPRYQNYLFDLHITIGNTQITNC